MVFFCRVGQAWNSKGPPRLDFLADSLATGLALVFGGSYALLASLAERYKALEYITSFLFIFSLGSPLAGFDVAVPWSSFSELCVVFGAFLFGVAVARYGKQELAEGEYD